MSDPQNLNKSSPGSFQQPTQSVENSLMPAVSNPAVGGTAKAVVSEATTATPAPQLGSSVQNLPYGQPVPVLNAGGTGGVSGGTSGVTAVTGTAPISSSGGTTPNIAISAATQTAAGSLSAADKTKLDSITSGAAPVPYSGFAGFGSTLKATVSGGNLTALNGEFQVYNVKDYGAVGDGYIDSGGNSHGTDDTAAINAAFAAAGASISPSVIYFPPTSGWYRIANTGRLTFQSVYSTSVQFVGNGATLLIDNVDRGAVPVISITGGNLLTIRWTGIVCVEPGVIGNLAGYVGDYLVQISGTADCQIECDHYLMLGVLARKGVLSFNSGYIHVHDFFHGGCASFDFSGLAGEVQVTGFAAVHIHDFKFVDYGNWGDQTNASLQTFFEGGSIAYAKINVSTTDPAAGEPNQGTVSIHDGGFDEQYDYAVNIQGVGAALVHKVDIARLHVLTSNITFIRLDLVKQASIRQIEMDCRYPGTQQWDIDTARVTTLTMEDIDYVSHPATGGYAKIRIGISGIYTVTRSLLRHVNFGKITFESSVVSTLEDCNDVNGAAISTNIVAFTGVVYGKDSGVESQYRTAQAAIAVNTLVKPNGAGTFSQLADADDGALATGIALDAASGANAFFRSIEQRGQQVTAATDGTAITEGAKVYASAVAGHGGQVSAVALGKQIGVATAADSGGLVAMILV